MRDFGDGKYDHRDFRSGSRPRLLPEDRRGHYSERRPRIHSADGDDYMVGDIIAETHRRFSCLKMRTDNNPWQNYRNKREATTLAVVIDLILDNRETDALEVLGRRWSALKLADANNGEWRVAKEIESALTTDSGGIPVAHLRSAMKNAKLRRAVGKAWKKPTDSSSESDSHPRRTDRGRKPPKVKERTR